MTIAVEGKLAVHEVGVGNVEGRGDKPAAQINCAGLGDDNTVGVDQIDLAIAGDLAGNRRCGATGHSIEDGRLGSWLDKLHRIALTHRKAGPVDDGTVAGLGDRGGCGAGRPYHRTAGDNLSALREHRLCMGYRGSKQCRTGQQGCQKAIGTSLPVLQARVKLGCLASNLNLKDIGAERMGHRIRNSALRSSRLARRHCDQ